MPKAQGKWHFGNGNVVEGVYTQTKKVEVTDGNPIKLTWRTTSDITEKQ